VLILVTEACAESQALHQRVLVALQISAESGPSLTGSFHLSDSTDFLTVDVLCWQTSEDFRRYLELLVTLWREEVDSTTDSSRMAAWSRNHFLG